MIVRSHMVRTLLGREYLRLLKNPSAIILLGLLTAIALLIALSRPKPPKPMICWVVYWEDSPWIEELKTRLPDTPLISVESATRFHQVDGYLVYPPNSCAIELRPPLPGREVDGSSTIHIHYRYSGKDANVLMPFLQWFWPVTTEHFSGTARFVQETDPIRRPPHTAAYAAMNAGLTGSFVSDVVTVELSTTMLLFVVQFFTCCHLLVSFTSQDRERGTLTAIVLSPVSTAELLIARYLFHLSLSLTVSATIVSILQPAALGQPLFWGSLVPTSLSLMAVGTVIAVSSRTQTTAGLLLVSYMLGGGVVFYLATRFSAFECVKLAMFERYSFPLLYLSLKHPIPLLTAPGFTMLMLLTVIWIGIAATLFKKLALH